MNLSYALALQDSLVGKGAALLWLLGGASLRVLEVAALKVEHIGGPGGYLHIVMTRAEGIFWAEILAIYRPDRSKGCWIWLLIEQDSWK